MKNLQEMDYSTFVGLINERNRPSGGCYLELPFLVLMSFLNQ